MMWSGSLVLRKYRFLIVAGLIAFMALWIIYTAAESRAVDTTAGLPAHNHISWANGGKLYGSCGSCTKSGSFITHIQKELNYLDEKLPGFNIAQLPVGGSFGSDDWNAVWQYQKVRDILKDGIVGNQTWSQMESDVFRTEGRLQAGLQVRFSMWNECRGYTNNGGPDTFVPVATQAEYNSWKANYPGNVSSFAADCSISGPGGGGGGGGGGGYYYRCLYSPYWSYGYYCAAAPVGPTSECVYIRRC